MIFLDFAYHLPIVVVLAGLLASYLVPALSFKSKKVAGYFALAAAAVMFVFSLMLKWQLNVRGTFSYALGGWTAPWGIEFNVDPLGVYMAMILTGVGFIILLYATRDLEHELSDRALGTFYTLYLLLIPSMVGLALTNDLFNVFVFMEITTITAVAIICVKDNMETIEASLKYLILSVIASASILMAIALLYMVTGHLNMSYVSSELSQALTTYPNVIIAAMALFLVGFGLKSALFPMHVWLPDAHGSAPSPSSAVLSGLVVKIYVVVLIRLFFQVFPGSIIDVIPVLEITLWLSSIGMVLGSMFAIVQNDIKKMLAYSSISQVGYIFFGISLVSFTAFQGSLFHILNHAIIKAMLFLVAGVIIYTTGLRRVGNLSGLGFKLPVTMICFTIGALGMIGIPGTSGFISKWYLALGALEAGRPFFVLIILVSSMLNGIYYLPIVINAFFGEKGEELEQIKFKPLPWEMKYTVIFLAFGVIFFGLFPSLPLGMVENAISLILEQ